MEHLSLEIFDCTEFTMSVTVPRYWNDEAYWNDGDTLAGSTQLQGIFDAPYRKIDYGEAGVDSSAPSLRFPTAKVPHATEGDEIVVSREIPNASGVIETTAETYVVGTVKPDGFGVTTCTLFQEV